jgi:hypothetical protein
MDMEVFSAKEAQLRTKEVQDKKFKIELNAIYEEIAGEISIGSYKVNHSGTLSLKVTEFLIDNGFKLVEYKAGPNETDTEITWIHKMV